MSADAGTGSSSSHHEVPLTAHQSKNDAMAASSTSINSTSGEEDVVALVEELFVACRFEEALAAGKHVACEKPLAARWLDDFVFRTRKLAQLAIEHGAASIALEAAAAAEACTKEADGAEERICYRLRLI